MDPKKKILIIDDEVIVRKTLSKILVEEGYSVCCVEDGDAALSKIKDNAFDLVLLDIKLSGMDGINILKNLRSADNNIPVVLISGFLTMENIERASRYGIFSYIRKPFRIDDLRAKVKRALKSRKVVKRKK
jgi:DNA-binding NtrC family response regulator